MNKLRQQQGQTLVWVAAALLGLILMLALGIDVGGRAFFSILSIAASIAIIAYMMRVRRAPLGFRVALSMILGGAVGNLMDRVFYGALYGEAAFKKPVAKDAVYCAAVNARPLPVQNSAKPAAPLKKINLHGAANGNFAHKLALAEGKDRGATVRARLRHGRGHLTRALLEGVAFGLKDSFALIQEAGLSEIRQVRASGGGAKSALWRQILADVLGTELVTVNTTEGAAFGAALLAGVGAGNWADVLAACREAITITGSTVPDPAQVEIYRQRYPAYRALYPALKATFDRVPAG